MKTIEELMSIKIIPEIMDEVAACKTTKQVKEVLLKNQSPAFRTMLLYVFYPGVKFSITELPPFRPDPGPIGLSPNSLYDEVRRFYVLLDDKVLPLEKKTEILTNILESIHPREAELVGRIIKRDLEIPLLTYDLVKETFPVYFP